MKIKKLEKDIGDLNDIIFKETKKFYLYGDSNFVSSTFFTELNKKIQSYGFILLLYTKSNYQLVNSTNRLIEGFQNFAQYGRINPVDIRITDPEICSKLPFYSKKYKYHFIINSLLFSSAVQGDINAIFITTNGLTDAKQILIERKLYQGIGVIFISEIENWDKIKNTSHWTNVVLTDSAFPTAAKHFAFAFETTDLNSFF